MNIVNELNIDEVERVGNTYGQSFAGLIDKVINGQLDLSPQGILSSFLHMMAGELFEQVGLMRNLFIIAILSALLKNLTDSFQNKGVGELGFYVSYIALVTVLFNSFQMAMGSMQNLIDSLTGLMEACLPLMVSLIVMTGSIGGAYAFHPIVLFVINVAASLIKNVIMPVIVLGAGVHIVNYLTEQEILSKFADLIKGLCGLAIKGITLAFMAAMSLQRVSSPIMDNLALKTTKAAAGAIPVVGDILTGAVDTVSSFAAVAKSGVSVAIVILTLTACAVPVIKMLVLVLIYKFTAAAIQPVCDERIVKCVDAIAGFSLLLLAAGVGVVIMFLFSVMIMLSF